MKTTKKKKCTCFGGCASAILNEKDNYCKDNALRISSAYLTDELTRSRTLK